MCLNLSFIMTVITSLFNVNTCYSDELMQSHCLDPHREKQNPLQPPNIKGCHIYHGLHTQKVGLDLSLKLILKHVV